MLIVKSVFLDFFRTRSMRCALVGFFFLLSLSASAYTRHRVYVADTVFAASQANTQLLIDSFVVGVQTDIDALFTWALEGTGKSGDDQKDSKGKDALLIAYTGNSYNPATRTGVLTMDVYVLGVVWGRNLKLTTKSSSRTENGWQITRLDLDYSGSALESAWFEFRTKPLTPTTTRVIFKFDLVFGKFFSLFITDAVWKKVIKWRIDRMVKNMADLSAALQTTGRLP